MKKLIFILLILAGCAPNYVELQDKYDNFTQIYKQKGVISGKFLFLTEDARTPREIAVILQQKNSFGFITVRRYNNLKKFHNRLYNAVRLSFPNAEFDTLTDKEQYLLEKGKIKLSELVEQYKADGIFMGKLYNLILSRNGDFRGTYRFQLKNLKTDKTILSGIVERKHKFNISTPLPLYIPFLTEWIASKVYRSGLNRAEEWFLDKIAKAIKYNVKISKKYYDFDRGFTGSREKDLSTYMNLSTFIGLEYILGATGYLLLSFHPEGEALKEILFVEGSLLPLSVISQDYINGNASGSMLGLGCLGSLIGGLYIYKNNPSGGDFMRPLLIGTGSMIGLYYGTKIRFQKRRDYKGGLKKQ